MGSKEHMVADLAMVADVVAAPHHHIVADGGERLQCVVFENEAVFTDDVVVHRGIGADIANEVVALFLALNVHRLTQAVHLAPGHGRKQLVVGVWEIVLQGFEGHHRQPFEHSRFWQVAFVHGKADHVHCRVFFQVVVRQLGGVQHSENDNFWHQGIQGVRG
ncbi:hypothetical protein D3C81_1303750 [compost metagenome]